MVIIERERVYAAVRQVSVTTTPQLIISQSDLRRAIHIKNNTAAVLYISNQSSVSTTTGYPIIQNAEELISDIFGHDTTSGFWAVASTGTIQACIIEHFAESITS